MSTPTATIGTQFLGQAFTVNVTYKFNESTWTDEYLGAPGPVVSPAITLTTSNWSFTHAGNLAVGNHTISEKDPYTSVTVTSNVFAVVSSHVITITPISSAVAGAAFAFTGALTGYTSAPALAYSLDGGTAVSMSGVTATGWTLQLTVIAAGQHTITVTDGSTITPVTTFTVAPVTANHVISIANLTPVSGTPNYVLYDTFTSLIDLIDSGGAGSWMKHYPFGGSEYTLSANSELEYFTSATRTPASRPSGCKAAARDRVARDHV
jgi:hypothetical protein